MRRTGSPLLVFVGLVLASAGAGAVPRVTAEVSAETIALGDRAIYTLTINDAAGGSLTLPRFGELEARGPSRSVQSSITIMNGRQRVESLQVYSWEIEAPREGTYLIGPATFEHHGEKFVSNAVELQVEGIASAHRAAPPQPKQAPQASPFGGQDPFGGKDPFDAFDDFGAWGGLDPWGRQHKQGEVFLSALVDKREVHLGEQVTLSLYLLSQADVAGVQTVSFPKLDGFWAEDIETPTQLVPEQKMVDGVPYHAYLLRRRALFPLRSGKLVIDPVEAQVNLGLAIFFGAPQETVKRKSQPLELEVKPLPAAGQPANFEASNVGAWSLSAQASPTTVALGQVVQLKVTLEGAGNVKGVRLPKPKLPPGLKSYDPTTADKVKVVGRRYGGTKTVEWVLVPERTGTLIVPPIEMPYFDPASASYKTARTEEIALEITAGAGAPPVAANGAGGVAAPTAENVLSGGIRPARLDASLGVTGAVRAPWKKAWFWPVTVAPVAAWSILLVGGLVTGALRRRDPDKLKVKRAKGEAGRRLKTARELLAANKPGEFLSEVSRALLQFVTDKTGIAVRGLTRDELRTALREKGFEAAHVEQLVRMLDACETARFAPGGLSSSAMQALLDDAARVVDAFDETPARAA